MQKQKELEELQAKKAASTKQTVSKKPSSDQTDDEVFNISRDEVVRRLRAKGQPIRLFAETDRECKLRLRNLELQEERAEEGGQNEYMRRLEEMEAGMRLDILKKGGDGDEKKKPKRIDAVVEPIDPQLIRSNREKLCMQIYVYLTHAMEEWDEAIDARPEEERQSGPGKRAAVLQKQTIEHIKPLLRRLKKMTMEPDVLARVAEITRFMQIRQYRDAQDSYLQLSIGNAPWPIGVTMVGIHERSAREKIFSSQVAHVLNDETSRKWIQGVKRLMTFIQTKYPPDTMSQLS
ncbi:Prp18 domain-containing protein [Gongronella butleri]|nr:Prp18 domain-containing protein [Gongronella butleri]